MVCRILHEDGAAGLCITHCPVLIKLVSILHAPDSPRLGIVDGTTYTRSTARSSANEYSGSFTASLHLHICFDGSALFYWLLLADHVHASIQQLAGGKGADMSISWMSHGKSTQHCQEAQVTYRIAPYQNAGIRTCWQVRLSKAAYARWQVSCIAGSCPIIAAKILWPSAWFLHSDGPSAHCR